ncbi:alpha/beta fold hydrolase [Mycolicibacterium goodii]|uniref:Hydrolase n=1 Tax=Mycolicibacterium goodii TaxID=134601 RepID=A0A0K0X0G6_MYCGD|nr:hydrolase [Mycolicibacterium goodii]
MDVGRVHYARNGSVHLAYRVMGEGETPLVLVPGFVSNVELYDDPTWPFNAMFEQLGASTRFVAWDKRGTGLSDPVDHVPTLDERMDDLHAVLDAAGFERPALCGISEGGPMSVLFAATFPERVRSLTLYGTAARFSRHLPDFPWGATPEQFDGMLEEIETEWGEGALTRQFFGPAADVPGFRELWGRQQRDCASPSMARMILQAVMQTDARAILGSVRAPTLVLARRGDQIAPFDASAAMAAAIPGAEFRELPPGDHLGLDLVDVLTPHILEFVCGAAGSGSTRVLATVLFTDIVGSTELLSAQGDSRWRRQLDMHDAVVDRTLARYGGRREKHTGDGVFALFDGPTKAARCSLELIPALRTHGIDIRAGVHIGECERRGTEWTGMAIHVGARVGALAGPGEVLTSRTVRDLSAGSGLIFESLGPQRLKGVPEDMEIFRIAG